MPQSDNQYTLSSATILFPYFLRINCFANENEKNGIEKQSFCEMTPGQTLTAKGQLQLVKL